MTGDRRGSRHRRADEMGASPGALPSLEVAIRRRRAALAGIELVRVHAEAHGAARLAPLEACVAEDPVRAFSLGLRFAQTGPRSPHRHADVGSDAPALPHGRGDAQILDARVGARADENLVELDLR